MNLRARLSMFAIVVWVVGCRAEADRPPEPEPVSEAPAWQSPEPAPTPAIDRSLGAGFELRRPVRELEVMLLASYVVDTDGPARVHSTLDPAAIRRFAASPLAVTTPASTIVLTERSAAEKRASLFGVTNK